MISNYCLEVKHLNRALKAQDEPQRSCTIEGEAVNRKGHQSGSGIFHFSATRNADNRDRQRYRSEERRHDARQDIVANRRARSQYEPRRYRESRSPSREDNTRRSSQEQRILYTTESKLLAIIREIETDILNKQAIEKEDTRSPTGRKFPPLHWHQGLMPRGVPCIRLPLRLLKNFSRMQ